MSMSLRGWCTLVWALLVLAADRAAAQRATSWRAFKLADGLPESACISVALAPQGRVLVKHLTRPAITQLDGYETKVVPLTQNSTTRVYESPGGQLWTLLPEGLQEFKEGAWVVHPLTEIAKEVQAGSTRGINPIALCVVKQGQVIALLPDRLVKYNFDYPEQPQAEVLRVASQTRLERFSDLMLSRDGGVWIAGTRGIAKVSGPVRNLKSDSNWEEFAPPEGTPVTNFYELHETAEGGVTLIGESTQNQQKVIVEFDGRAWSLHGVGEQKIRHAWRGPDGQGWAASIDSLFQWREGSADLVENEDLSARQYFDVAVEPGGTFWLATTEGLFRYAPLAWQAPEAVKRFSSVIHCMSGDGQGKLWYIAGGVLHGLLDEKHEEIELPEMMPAGEPVRALFTLKAGGLVLQAGDRLFGFEPEGRRFKQIQFGAARAKALGLLQDGRLAVECWQSKAGGSELFAYDGVSVAAFPAPAPEATLGAHLSTIFGAQNGDLWVSGELGTARYHDKKWRAFVSSDKTTPENGLFFCEMPDGRIWCATPDSIWEFDGKNWSASRRGFDRINGMVRSPDGSVWVASSSGLYRYSQGAWVENGLEEGLPSSAIRQIVEDQRGRLWAGTLHGLSLYHPDADSDPPRTYLQEFSESEKNIRQGSAFVVSFTGRDRWKVTARDRLLYSHRLDDGEWSPFQEANTVSFNELATGKHYFQVRAMDRNCNLDPKPASLEFAVVLPWYRETRLVGISLAGMAVAVFFAALAFKSHRQLVRSYAEVEKKVAQRTHELEMANRELLHSQKMTALGTLAAGIAHDFNNILSIIKGSAQIIEDNVDKQEKIRTRVDRIKTVVEQGSGIVKAMLGFSRDSEQQTGYYDVNAIVDDTLKLLGDRFLREVEVEFRPALDLPEASFARDFVQQILLNFIFNAAESLSERKRIVVSTLYSDEVPPGVVLAPAKTRGWIRISVQDFGCGIAPENMGRIFEPFFTTKAFSARRGTGLGLSMVYELAKKMEAGIAVETVVDKGSTFTLIMPVRGLGARGTEIEHEHPEHTDHRG
jgi:signal transduction histidine kinase/streptogramin lyase